MALTPDQLVTLKADILANPDQTVIDALAAGDASAIATFYNQDAVPDFTVWRTDILPNEVNEAVDWDEVVSLTTNKLLAFDVLKTQDSLNAAKPSIRQAFTSIFTSNQQPNSNAALIALAKRLATRAETLFATGLGSDASPGTMTFTGTLSYQDVANALQS